MNAQSHGQRTLGHYHTSIAALLASTMVSTNFQLGGAFALAKLAGVTVTKKEHRPEVVEALGLLKATVGKATHLKKADREMVESEIDASVTAIGAHPDDLPKAGNGHADHSAAAHGNDIGREHAQQL